MPRLRALEFTDRTRAIREMATLAAAYPEGVADQLDLLLASSPAPEQGLRYMVSFAERHGAVLRRLCETPAALRYLTGLFTHSRFLSDSLLEHPGWAAQLLDNDDLNRVISHEDLRRRLARALPPGIPDPTYFAGFRRRQLLRIVVRDIFGLSTGLSTIPEITGELTALADVIVETAYARIHAEMVAEHGTPRDADGAEAHFAVVALGKMGAEELNYSSDIDLMFLYSAGGETDGTRPITNHEFFVLAARQLTTLLSTFTTEGLCYRVDLRLRPDGNMGELCISLEGAKQYYETRARDWELQMLIKARVAAGHRATGQKLLAFVAPKTYSTTLDFSTIEQLSATRDRLNEKLSHKRDSGRRVRRHAAPEQTSEAIDVKLDRGGIRDIEFLVQCLQRLQGGAEPWLQHRSTVPALARFHDKGILADTDYGRLAAAYQFFRNLEHRLQFDEDRQTHALPRDSAQLEILARRMPTPTSSARLMEELEKHFANVTTIYHRVIHMKQQEGDAGEGLHSATLLTTLDMSAPRLAAAVAGAGLERGAPAFEHFLDGLAAAGPGYVEQLNDDAKLIEAALDLFEHSPFLAEDLVRRPTNVFELNQPWEALLGELAPGADAAALRRWYRRGILRVEAAALGRSQPVFETLEAHSQLAESVVRHLYGIALEAALQADTSARVPMTPEHMIMDESPLWIIALGRLGMREFDLGSDADLAFVLDDRAAESAEALAFWTRIAERLVMLIGAYTGEGTLFAVDTRLRPNGGAGPLVQSASTVLDYFAEKAEAWESITYLKARSIAGHAAGADAFLKSLQQTYWNRYGEMGTSRSQLREMRDKLERETGKSRPLKAGRGGYYDIDFLLLYLRLKNAGVYYRTLNTPQRIDVSEAIGALSRGNANFLREVASFYRAVDHGIRLVSGRAEGSLPKSASQRDALEALLPRWTSIPLEELPQVQLATRTLFERLFG